MTDFSKTLIHCSAIGLIMTGMDKKTPQQEYIESLSELDRLEELNNKAKNKTTSVVINRGKKIEILKHEIAILEIIKDDELPLSVTCKSHLKNVYWKEKYGKEPTFKDRGNKFTRKGKAVELEAIELISALDGVKYIKNDERVDNDFISGIPDAFLGESVRSAYFGEDVKSSWDSETFGSNIGEQLDKDYWWQAQGYMDLTGAKKWGVSYCLLSLPMEFMNEELIKVFNSLRVATEEAPEYKEAAKRFINNTSFDEIPQKDRRYRYFVDYNEEIMQKVYRQVERCRDWLYEYEAAHLKVPNFEKIDEILVE